jgi:hypothetical protein
VKSFGIKEILFYGIYPLVPDPAAVSAIASWSQHSTIERDQPPDCAFAVRSAPISSLQSRRIEGIYPNARYLPHGQETRTAEAHHLKHLQARRQSRPAKRGQAFALFGIAVVVAPVVGPTLGGWLSTTFPGTGAF